MKYGKPKKIFVVDDDPMILSMIDDFLTGEVPHEVSLYRTGEECLSNMKQNPDVVILDYNLSNDKNAANGIDILKEIKKHYDHVPVIMLSSQEKYSVALQAIQKGAVQYVMKDEQAFEKIASMINEME